MRTEENMMREILFRGIKKPWGGWCEGSLVKMRDYFRISTQNDLISFGVETESIGQFTGLTDKNGKKIFEGDIVEHHVQGNILVNRGVVNWDKENARWAYRLNTMNPCFALYNPKAFEVIGNIHDNPELLGGAEDGK